MPNWVPALLLSLFCLAVPAPLLADASEQPGSPPGRQGAFSVGPETGLVIPLSTDRLCPPGYGCIADIGWAVSVGFSYRWPRGIGLGLAYEFWLLTANAVYEMTVPQSFVAVLRHSFLADRKTHPLLRLRGGFLMLGPSFRVATLGGVAEIGVGGEVEIAPDTLIKFLVTGNLLRTQAFVTPGDDAARATSRALDAMLVLRLGIDFLL